MTWATSQGLQGRISTLPLVLSGPILRQVTPTSVTVWIATKVHATLELVVSDDKNTVLMRGTLDTVAMGKNLHIAAVTASLVSGNGPLTEGNIYLYDINFGDLYTLATAVGGAKIAYPPYSLPSFCLPPKDLNKLRLVHGSCRKPHGEGPDALALLDGLIAPKASAATDRPHQLLLTGDQIYADDVADVLLLMIRDASKTLLGWDETLDTTPITSPIAFKDWPSYYRLLMLTEAQFTSDDLKSHLCSFGDFFSMYMFVWSDVLWPAVLPTFDDVAADVTSFMSADKRPALQSYLNDHKHTIVEELGYVAQFKSTLSSVRRALANIPTYMICDDHEVTDDWNMTRRFCSRVYGTSLGVRVVQNGLVAFSVCQAWGNDPDRFVKSPASAGAFLLALIASVASGSLTYDKASGALQVIVGVHPASSVLSAGRVFHDNEDNVPANAENSTSLRFNFRIEGTGHLIFVTDTRTWRGFPNPAVDAHADFLESTWAKSEIGRQLNLLNPLNDRLLMVVLTTNAPPIASFRYAASHPTFVDVAGHPGGTVEELAASVYEEIHLAKGDIVKVELRGAPRAIYENDLYDSWEFPSAQFDSLMVQLDAMLQAQKRTQQVILLSGDVHSSFASRLTVFGASDDGIVDTPRMVVAQLVSSSLKNQTKKTRGQQLEGYTYAPKEIARHWVPDFEPEAFDGPTLSGSASSIYRLDYLVADPGQQSSAKIPDPLVVQEGEDVANLRNYSSMASFGRSLVYEGASPLQIIGHNNLAELTFVWSTDKRALHTLHWSGANGASYSTTYSVSLNPVDGAYKVMPVPEPDDVE